MWSKPASSTKQKEDHVVPLSAPARQLLSEIREQPASSRPRWRITSSPRTASTGHIVEIKKAWRAHLQGRRHHRLRIHDLRHSFASQLASGGASLPLIGALLGHSNPTTTQRYAHLFAIRSGPRSSGSAPSLVRPKSPRPIKVEKLTRKST